MRRYADKPSKEPAREITIAEELTGVMNQWLEENRQAFMPKPFPADSNEAAKWWIDVFLEKRGRLEKQHLYAVRLINLFRKFAGLPSDHREFIHAAREDGVYWRGDDFDFFVKVYDETLRMREIGIEKYRKDALQLLRIFLGKVTQQPAA